MEKIIGKTQGNPQIRIAVTGPESSGKTTLAKELSEHYGATMVPEYARKYLEIRNGNYSETDLLTIAKKQIELQNDAFHSDDRLIISDTELTVISIWSRVKYGSVDPWIKDHSENTFDLYLLCKPDLEWSYDPLRENPNDRDKLFELYIKELDQLNARYKIIEGKNRLESAISHLDPLLS